MGRKKATKKQPDPAYLQLLKERDGLVEEIRYLNNQLENRRKSCEFLTDANNNLKYEVDRRAARIEALLYTLVLAQAHAAPLQKKAYNDKLERNTWSEWKEEDVLKLATK